MATLALASCAKELETQALVDFDGSQVSVSFVAEPNTLQTRAFFDNAASTETWEKSLSSLSIYVFNSSGSLLVQRKFTSAELTNKKAIFALPRSAAGTTCNFYAVANRTLPEIANEAAIKGILEEDPAAYNGTFAEVTTKAKRTAGFVMSGMVSKAVGAINTTTEVPVTLKRTVAKIAVQTTLSADFSSRYSGKVRINTTTISRAAGRTTHKTPAGASTATPFSHTQTANEVSSAFNNLFYIYENGTLSAGSRVLLTMEGTYDRDGNFSTTGDQMPITYTCEISGTSNNGSILRNGYYRVAVSISGLMGQDVSTTVTVADWEAPLTQSINLGQ